MTDAKTAAYYRYREEHERVMVASARRLAAAIHRDMAERYGRLITTIAPTPEPRL